MTGAPSSHSGGRSGRTPGGESETLFHVVPGQRWESLDPRDEGLKVAVLATSGVGGYVTIQWFRKSRVKYERFVKLYRLVER